MAEHTLRVCALYPDLMNIYADRGNLLLLERRCNWRGIGFEVTPAGLGERVDPDAHDLFYLGGGQDRDQRLCAFDLVETKRDALHEAAGAGKLVLGVCGGYQLLGHAYQLHAERLPGIGLVDLETVREEGPRLIGNVAIEVDLGQVHGLSDRGQRKLHETLLVVPVEPAIRAVLEGGGEPESHLGGPEVARPRHLPHLAEDDRLTRTRVAPHPHLTPAMAELSVPTQAA